jgi:hypothetical protein
MDDFERGARSRAIDEGNHGQDEEHSAQATGSACRHDRNIRNLDWSTYPLKPHQVAACAPTP